MKIEPLFIGDFSSGVYRRSAVSHFLAPQNSVSFSQNINFDTTIGKATVRNGTTKLGSTVAAGKTPLGLTEFVLGFDATQSGGTNDLIAVYSGSTSSTIYYYNGSWNTSTVNNLSNTAKNRFAQIGGKVFRANGTDAMTESQDGNTWTTTNCATAITPALLFSTKNVLLASGHSSFKSRVYFSSVIAPNSSPFLTWNLNQSTGNWIDINPDDGSDVTGFADTSTVALVFKGKAMYRLNVITTTVDTDNVFNIGAVSQEAITKCQGVVYFFSGQDIRRTSGDFPEQISRLGVQDFVDAIPQSSWTNVVAGNDGFNVYFSIGNVTLFTNTNDQVTYNNVILKFSVRDQAWSIHSYADQYRFFAQYTTSANGRTMVGAETSGNVQTLNIGTTDNGTSIFYALETQEQNLGNRAHLKKIADKIVVFTKNGEDSEVQVRIEDKDYKKIPMTLSDRVNIGRDVDLEGRFFSFRWLGNSQGTAPVLDGFYVENITDQGIV